MSAVKGAIDALIAQPTAQESQYNPKTEFDGSRGFIQTGPLSEEPRSHDEILELFGYDLSEVRIVGSPKISRWQTYDERWLASYKFNIAPTSKSDIDDLMKFVMKGKAHKPKALTGVGVFNFQAGDQQLGKAISDDVPVFTPSGWVMHGDIRPGDEVFAPNGQPVKVVAVTGSSTQELFDVEFDKGVSVRASGDHLWTGWRKYHPKVSDPRHGVENWVRRHATIPTSEIAKFSLTPNVNGTMHQTRAFNIQMHKPLSIPDRDDLLIEPHLLGLWLGNGAQSAGHIYGDARDMPEYAKYGEARLVTGKDGTSTVTVPGLRGRLASEGILGKKTIPAKYIMSGESQRLALLQGLMDSDGSCAENGVCEFSNTNFQIADSVEFLLSSLGFKFRRGEYIGRVCGVDKKPYVRLSITPKVNMPLFRFPRKAARLPVDIMDWTEHRQVQRVAPAGLGSAQCLTVQGGLYLVGKEMVVTHNCDGDGTEGTIARFLDSIEVAKAEFKGLKNRRKIGGINIMFPGDCLEGVVSQNGKNIWRTDLTITEQMRVFRRLLMRTADEFAPLADHVWLRVVNGNHDEATRAQNTRPDDGYATEQAIAVADALELNDARYGHVKVEVPPLDQGWMTVNSFDTVYTIAHGNQWRRGKAMDWLANQALHATNVSATQILCHGHEHRWTIDTNGARTVVCSPAYDGGSAWLQNGSHGLRGGLTYVSHGKDITDMRVV